MYQKLSFNYRIGVYYYYGLMCWNWLPWLISARTWLAHTCSTLPLSRPSIPPPPPRFFIAVFDHLPAEVEESQLLVDLHLSIIQFHPFYFLYFFNKVYTSQCIKHLLFLLWPNCEHNKLFLYRYPIYFFIKLPAEWQGLPSLTDYCILVSYSAISNECTWKSLRDLERKTDRHLFKRYLVIIIVISSLYFKSF